MTEIITIRRLAEQRRPEPTAVMHHAVVTRGTGGAIVSARWPAQDGPRTVVGIERYPYEARPILARVHVLKAADPDAIFVIDREGIGDAIHELLGKPRRGHGFELYDRHGAERAELTRFLIVGAERRSFAFAPGLAEAGAMKKALAGLTRNVREDGPGSELAVALSLAIGDWRRPRPRIG